eukprot:TRINITY_DN297_c0_g1_i2.p1 TRINITY_DN297_c0_g1~~TRINITY_DN297_c0_g1_i2.p1  ORF type:complete len:388 (+),score=36.08 TRINITY_DN297_c0_g1_i2:98-1261(+)
MSRQRDHPYARGGYSGRGGSDRGPPRYDPYPSRQNDREKSEAPAKEKPTRTLFVRNISYDYSPDEIEQMFAKYGKIKKFFNLISKRGMAFITYFDLRHADKAKRELQDYKVNGRSIDIHYSLPKDEEKDQEEDPNNGTLFITIRNATQPIGNTEVRKFFEGFGDVREVRDCRNSPTQKFVEFWDLRDCQNVYDNQQGAPLLGGSLDIKFAHVQRPKKDESKSGPVRADRDNMGPTLGQLGVGAPLNLGNPMTMNPALANPLLSLNPQLLALLSNPLLSQGLTGLGNPSGVQPDQSAVLSQMSQLAQLLQGGGNTGLNLGYGGVGSTPNQSMQSQQSVPGQQQDTMQHIADLLMAQQNLNPSGGGSNQNNYGGNSNNYGSNNNAPRYY